MSETQLFSKVASDEVLDFFMQAATVMRLRGAQEVVLSTNDPLLPNFKLTIIEKEDNAKES